MKSEKMQAPMSKDRKPLHTLLPLSQPLSVFIDPSDACNFRCKFCFQHHKEMNSIIMTDGLFDKICEQLKEFAEPIKKIHLHGFGEPLINKHIAEYVKKIKSEHIADVVEITTNGSLLTPDLSDALVEAGLDNIIFSIYSLKDEGYMEFSGAKASFNNIYENIKYLSDIRKGEQCHIHAKIVGDYFSGDEQDRFIEMFEPIVDTLYIDRAANIWPDVKVDEASGENQYGVQFDEKMPVCPLPFYAMLIHSDGVVSPCCVDYGKRVIVGDVNRQRLKDIWNGDIYQELRRDMLRLKPLEGTGCEGCEYMYCGSTVDITPYRDELLKKY